MPHLRRWILIGLLACAAVPRLWAASAAENRDFEAATNSFRDKVWDRAEAEFAAFRQDYTNSTRLPEAILFQAEARLHRGNYEGAISLLKAKVDLAGNWGDEYFLFIGEAQFQKGDFKDAAESFAKVVHTFPASARRLEALIRQATARAKLATAADWQEVRELLQQTNGLFQAVARTNTANQIVWRGYLLLGEALLAETNCAAAEAALQPMSNAALSPELDWQRRYLLCQIQLEDNRPDVALQNATNLLALAKSSGQPRFPAESAVVLGRIYERLGRPEEAVAAYQLNLPEGTPPELQRQAVHSITRLLLAHDKVAEAALVLQHFLEQTPGAKSADLALLTLGELRLRLAAQTPPLASATNAPQVSNSLPQAVAALESFTNKFPQSPLFGKAELALGWCFWLSNAMPESQAAFQAAVQHLPGSTDSASAYDLALAQFKLADTQFRQTNYAAAIPHYRAVAEQFKAWPEVQTNLSEPALYQVVRAGLNAGDLPAASNALSEILTSFPNSFFADRAVLCFGQVLGGQDPAAARRLFLEFARQATNSLLRPELELAIARTYEQEDQWDEAIAQYDEWLATAPTNQAELPQALYLRAMAYFWRAGYQTNTLTQLTNLLERFPMHSLAPQARWWVANYYDYIGRLEAAEANFQLIFQNTNWTGTTLAYQAKMAAGRVAFKRTSWEDARGYFGGLAGNTNCPGPLRAQAYFALGSTFMASQESTNKTDYQQALRAFDQAAFYGANDRIAVLALGEKADCYLQLHDYASASNYYQLVLHTNLADVAARSAAAVGLGVVLEKLATERSGAEAAGLLVEARDHYLDVFYQKLLRPGEKADPYWTEKSGMEAARLLTESFKQLEPAIRIYEDLQDSFPFLRLTDRINTLKAQQLEARQRIP